jgi:hypothetical protein
MKTLNILDRLTLAPTNDGTGKLCKCSELK